MRFSILLAIALAGALGALVRYAVMEWTVRLWGSSLFYGTLAVNVAGCLLIGFLFHAKIGLSTELRLILGSGFLGALTTFSAFGMETFAAAREGRVEAAVANVAANLVLGLAAVALGYFLAGRLTAS
ncbi:MAG: fluoride efflux transporter CrcB [Planctomycetota bacterium]|nr:MAG: fluoride efflux transporter CrcB [Planctomycetota bacterium]REK49089.1 MAG: fluoride efflux transporter CrcB [Planctomycetota bacterium]